MRLPGLIDPHVHMREPGATHKEDWDSGTAAALAGGFTLLLAMPNTSPPVTDQESFQQALSTARHKARCDHAQYLGASSQNAHLLPELAPRSAGLKMYLDQTYGPLRLDEIHLWKDHFTHWPSSRPIVAHAEGKTMAAIILMSALFDRSVHLAHVSTREEILLIRMAKERGLQVTCEVTPHHLFLTREDVSNLGPGRAEVRPRLASQADLQALWDNMPVIDCFATDHAPHTLEEKDSPDPPPGFPGLETALPLFLTAVHAGRLSIDDLGSRMHTNPRKIFDLPDQPETWIEADPDQKWQLYARNTLTRCGWTPFEGWKVRGKIRRVHLRGKTVYDHGRVLAPPGYGRNVRQ